MGNTMILDKILEVYAECRVDSFPVDCLALLRHYGYKIYTYETLQWKNEQLFEMAVKFSEDAFRYKNLICYNAHKPIGRIRFSLMHELGHHILMHSGETAENEVSANYFASNILAPRAGIYYAGCKNANDVRNLFQLTYEASDYAFNDFRRWRRHMITHGHMFSVNDTALYQHFYNKELEDFVWSIRKCPRCKKPIYNDLYSSRCQKCSQHESKRKKSPPFYDDPVFGLFCDERSQRNIRIAEYKRFYGEDL